MFRHLFRTVVPVAELQDLAVLFRQLLQVEGIIGQEFFSQLLRGEQRAFSYDYILENPDLIIKPIINNMKSIAESEGYDVECAHLRVW
jgi:hypothetical protein